MRLIFTLLVFITVQSLFAQDTRKLLELVMPSVVKIETDYIFK